MGMVLCGAQSYGTLAAARALGERGVRVILADDDRAGFGMGSCFVSERTACPPVSDTSRFLEWLFALGRSAPRANVLYPSSDHHAWLFAAHRAELDSLFLQYQPEEACLIALLDKHRLREVATSVGLEMPKTRVAGSGEDLEEVARTMPFPLLLKPRTQIFLSTGIKGVLVSSPEQLRERIAVFRRLLTYDRALEDRHPEVVEPLVQEYLPAAEQGVFSVSGFRTREGALETRSAMKVLQRPRRLGIGLCFESCPEEPALRERLSALCAKVGYYGSFEAEFIVSGTRRLLIDFNPRFFSQMGFDLARGLDHALLTYFCARGERAQAARLLDEARAWRTSGDEAYCHRAMLELVLDVQRVSGSMSGPEVGRWRVWLDQHQRHLVDAVWSREDPLPAVMDTIRWLGHFTRHPLNFARRFVLNQ